MIEVPIEYLTYGCVGVVLTVLLFSGGAFLITRKRHTADETLTTRLSDAYLEMAKSNSSAMDTTAQAAGVLGRTIGELVGPVVEMVLTTHGGAAAERVLSQLVKKMPQGSTTHTTVIRPPEDGNEYKPGTGAVYSVNGVTTKEYTAGGPNIPQDDEPPDDTDEDEDKDDEPDEGFIEPRDM